MAVERPRPGCTAFRKDGTEVLLFFERRNLFAVISTWCRRWMGNDGCRLWIVQIFAVVYTHQKCEVHPTWVTASGE